MPKNVCRHCYGTGVYYWPISGSRLIAVVCEWCKGKRS